MTQSSVCVKSFEELKSSSPVTPKAAPITINNPMETGLGFWLIKAIRSYGFGGGGRGRFLAPRKKLLHRRITGVLQHFARAAVSSHRAGVGIEENRVVGNSE